MYIHDLMVESDGDLGDILVVVLGNDKSWISLIGAPWLGMRPICSKYSRLFYSELPKRFTYYSCIITYNSQYKNYYSQVHVQKMSPN